MARTERGPSTSDSDSGQHLRTQISLQPNAKMKLRPSSRTNFKVSSFYTVLFMGHATRPDTFSIEIFKISVNFLRFLNLVTLMLVTTLCWPFLMVTDVGDRILMLATFFVMFMIFTMYWIGHQHLKLVANTFCRQHILSPTSVPNIVSPFILRYLDPNRVNLVRCNKDDYHHVSCLQKRNCLRNQNQAIVRPASNNIISITQLELPK